MAAECNPTLRQLTQALKNLLMYILTRGGYIDQRKNKTLYYFFRIKLSHQSHVPTFRLVTYLVALADWASSWLTVGAPGTALAEEEPSLKFRAGDDDLDSLLTLLAVFVPLSCLLGTAGLFAVTLGAEGSGVLFLIEDSGSLVVPGCWSWPTLFFGSFWNW